MLIGGFLGAGKTAAMIAFGRWLGDRGIRAGFVTNDQGSDLVDTRMLQYCGLATEEIAGGCFCCRFNELVDATHRLRAVLQPDVFVAEAVGSCTDLAATVIQPMRRLLEQECTIGPLSVLVDPARARRALGLDVGETLSDDVQYIYRKQLEEADIIVISKCELLTSAGFAELRAALEREFPRAVVLGASAHEGTGLDEWFNRALFDEPRSREVMEVDYDRYAKGEASLGWLNASLEASSAVPCDGNTLLMAIACEVHRRVNERGAVVAHLKMTLESSGDLATINLVRNESAPEPGLRLRGPISTAQLTFNLRAMAPPELLEAVLRDTIDSISDWTLHVSKLEAFRPGRPVPTHRDTVTPPST